MPPEGLRLFLRLGMFVTLGGLFLVLLVPRGTAEFVVSALTLVVGLTLVGLVALATWWMRR